LLYSLRTYETRNANFHTMDKTFYDAFFALFRVTDFFLKKEKAAGTDPRVEKEKRINLHVKARDAR